MPPNPGPLAADRAAREAELRLHAFFEGSADAIGIARDGRYVFVNAALATLFGYGAPAELIGKPVASVTSPTERERVALELRQRVTGEGTPAVYRTRGLRRDGSEFDLEVRATPFREGDSAVTMAILRDVSVERAAEVKLQASEQRFRELFELVPVALWEVDLSGVRAVLDRLRAAGVTDLPAHFAAHAEPLAECEKAIRVLDVNATTLRAFGAGSRDVLLARLDEVLCPEARAHLGEALARFAERGVAQATEGWIGTLTGALRWVSLSLNAVPGHEVDWKRVLVATVDLTEQHRAESRLSAIFDAAAEPMAFTVGGRFERVNDAFARQFGFARAEAAIGLSVGDLVTPGELARLKERHQQRLAGTPPPDHYTTRALRRDGTEFDVEVKTAGIGEGDQVATVSVMRDVTEQLAFERRVTESERRFRELFEFVPVSLWEVDATEIRAALDRVRGEGNDVRAWVASHPEELARLVRSFRLVSLNAYGCQLAGGSSKEEVLANLDKVEIPEAAARYAELGLQLLEGRAIARAEGWGGTVGGDRRWIETAVTALPGHEETWSRLLFASIDVTDRRRAEEERAALHERLRQAEKLEAVGRLAGGIAHDFNNILSGILGYAELSLLSAERGTDLHDHQERIREAALRARALIRQILTFSQRERPNQRIVDVPTVVKEALGLMRAGIPSTATLEARIDQDAGATLADPTQIHQIVLNLCSNARDAIGPYGRILVEVVAVAVDGDVGALPPGEYVRLRVRDDGAGMDAETQARIFEPYMTTKGPFGGHGLGLPVVHGIVSAAGGAIQVASSPGQGSTFDVYLPRREEAAPEHPRATPGVAGRGERILLVDDDALVRNTHRRLLESLGYTVTAAADGEEALLRFKESPDAYAAVLTDQTMPTLSGADLARALLAIRGDVPVILCTGYSDQIDDRRARELGVRSLLQKPIDRQTLAAAIQGALRG